MNAGGGEPWSLVTDADDLDDPARDRRGWRPQPWWAWTLGLLGTGAVSLLVAGALLASADFGTSLRPRGCDASPLPGLAMLAVAGLAIGMSMQVARLRWPEAFVVWDAGSLVLSLPIPLAVLAAALPAALGCAAGRTIAQLAVVGDPLVGTSGIALAGASSALVGVGIAGAAHVGWVSPEQGGTPSPGIVELAMQEAEALRADEAAARFHGVESGE